MSCLRSLHPPHPGGTGITVIAVAATNPDHFVSTGSLPTPEDVQRAVEQAHEEFLDEISGVTSDVYPALAKVDPDLFGISVVGVTGAVYYVGDAAEGFTIMSVAKPFVFALACELFGHESVRNRIGVNATGLAFNSVEAISLRGDGRTNPMVNPGAIATTSLIPGDTVEKWETILDCLSRFAGRRLEMDADVYRSATATNLRNREIVAALSATGAIYGDPDDSLDVYTRQSSLIVTARDLAVMGATLADGGVNPITGARVVSESTCRHSLSVMATAGLYETSGDWLYEVGLPAKSGIGGGIVTISPGKGGLGVFSPRLDAAGNSVRGQEVARYLSSALGLDLFVSEAKAPGS